MSYGDYEDKKYLRELAAKAGVENVHWVKRIINSTLFLQDPKKRQKLLTFLYLKLQQNIKEDHPFLPAPKQAEVSQGSYELAKIVTGRGLEYPARIQKADAPEHGIVVGPSGAGKTNWLISRFTGWVYLRQQGRGKSRFGTSVPKVSCQPTWPRPGPTAARTC
jgi:hypothetical protein